MNDKNLIEKFKKAFNSFAVLTLLLPNLMSVGVVAAAEEPAVEEVQELATDEEVEEPVEETETPEEPETETEVEEEPPVETPEADVEEVIEEPVVEEAVEEPVVEDEEIETLQETDDNEFGDPTEVRTLIYVRAPQNMTNYANTLNDFAAHPIILTNQVTGEVFRGTLKSDEGNTSNNFTFDTTVHAYERGNQPSGRYSITLPQELIDLGYSLSRDQSIQTNFGIVGSTTLRYNAPQNNESLIQLSKATPGYDYFERQDLSVTFTSSDGLRTYTLNNSTISIPSGEYNFRMTGSPADSRPQLIHRDSSLRDAPEREISLTQDGEDYIGTVTLNYLNSTRPQIFSLRPIPLEVIHTVTIDPGDDGTMNDDYRETEVVEGENYRLPLLSRSGLANPGYTLVGFEVTEGTLLDSDGNTLSEIPTYSTIDYTLSSDVTLSAIWEETSGKFRIYLYDDNPLSQKEKYSVFLVAEDGTEYELSSNSFNSNYREWEIDVVPNGSYTLVIDGFMISEESKFGHPDTTSNFVINEDGTATLDLEFKDNSTTTFIRYRVYGDPIPETNTVTIDPGDDGTIDEAYAATEINEGETYTLPYNFQSNLARPGYTLTGYTVEGTLLDANGNEVTEIPRFTNVYTPMSDVTLTANWEITNGGFRVVLYDENPATQTDRYSVTLIAEDGSEYELSSRSYNRDSRTWTIDGVPNGTYTLVVDGFTISEGEKYGQPDTTSNFELNEDGTATVELEFVDDKTTTFIRYRVYGDPIPSTYNVTIDPNGGTINEAYATTEINAGETYTVPYTFQSNLARPGYTLTGYTVEGTLLDANGNEVTELSRFTGVYTPMSDVTLTANWEVTSGGFRIRDRIDGFITADRSFALTDGENTYPLTSNSYTNQYRTWTVDDVPNGVYTLLVDGVAYPNEWNLETTNSNSSASIADDGTVTVDLTFADNSTTTFVRFDLTMNEYEVGVEVRDLNNRRTSDVGIRVENEEGTVFEGSYDQYNLWTTNSTVLPGLYTITLDTPDGTVAEINDTVASQVAEATEEDNVFTILVNAETRGNLSRVFGAFRLVEAPEEIETHPLGIEVRDLDGVRTSDVTIYVQDEDGVVFSGSYNQYAQWITDEELSVGEYTITLRTPENTYAVVQDTTQQHAVPTDRQNVFTIVINEENRGNLSRVFAAFELVEMEYRLGVEVRGLDGRRTNEVTVYVQDTDGVVFEGSYNEYSQWLTEEELSAGEYTITLQTPDNTYAVVNETTPQFANPTDRENVFTIELNETNLGSSSAIYGAFQLVEREYRLGVEVRGLNGRRTDEVTVVVTNEDDEVFEGAYNQYLQWLTDEELSAGEYTITLTTPEGTVAEINDTTNNYAAPTDEENVFTIELNETNLGSSSAIYGAFQLVEVPVKTEQYSLGIEVRDLSDSRTTEVGVVVTNEDGEVFEGSYNDALQWLTDEELPVGEYTITLTTPEGTIAVINDTVASQEAVPTDEDNVFTILVNAENLNNLSSVYGAFRLVEIEEEPIDPIGPEEPEEPIVPGEPDDPDNGDNGGEVPEAPETDPKPSPEDPEDDDPVVPSESNDPADSTDPDSPEEVSADLPKAGVATTSIGLAIASLLSGIGLYAISKKRKEN